MSVALSAGLLESMVSLVIAASSNIVKYSSYFRALGMDVVFVILETQSQHFFRPYQEHRVFVDGHMLYVDETKNIVSSHQNLFRINSNFVLALKKMILGNLTLKINKISKPINELVLPSENKAIEFYYKDDVLGINYDKKNKKIMIEVKNKGVLSFDHLFCEETDLALDYINHKNNNIVDQVNKNHMIWTCYVFKTSKSFAHNDFWYIENKDYESLFDNCFYIQPVGADLKVWALTPYHQKINQKFHDDFSKRLSTKIENKFRNVTISLGQVDLSSACFMDSTGWHVNENNRISALPCMSLYTDEQVQSWFKLYARQFMKKHKIKEVQT